MPAAKPLGGQRETELRGGARRIVYIERSGCQWRMCRRLSPFTTVPRSFYDGETSVCLRRINFALRLEAREPAGLKASPRPGGDRQSIGQADESVGRAAL